MSEQTASEMGKQTCDGCELSPIRKDRPTFFSSMKRRKASNAMEQIKIILERLLKIIEIFLDIRIIHVR